MSRSRGGPCPNLLGGVLGDSLGAFRHGVLGQLSREHEADGGLDLAGRQSGLLVVAAQFASLASDALEDVVDEGVHDGHGLLGDASVGVNLLQHLVDVGGVGLDAGLSSLAGCSLLASFASFTLASLSGCGCCCCFC